MAQYHPPDDEFSLPIAIQPLESQSTTMTLWLEQTISSVESLRRDQSSVGARLEQQRDDLDVSTLYWLIAEVSDSDAVAVGFQALGAIHPISALADRLRVHDEIAIFSEQAAYTRSAAPRGPAEILRALRSGLSITRHSGSPPREYFRALNELSTSQKDYPDIAMFNTQIKGLMHNASSWYIGSPSITSTVVHVLRVFRLEFKLRLGLLLCCNFSDLSDPDWEVLFEAIYIDTTSFSRVVIHPRLHSTKIPRMFRLADLLSDIALHARDSDERDLATQLIPRLISCQEMRYEAHPSRSSSLSSLPFLLDFLASERFLPYMHNLDDVRSIAKLLSLDAEVLTSNSIMIPKFWRAINLISEMTLNTPDASLSFRILSDTCTSALKVCLVNVPAIDGTLFGILGTSSVSPTLWKLLTRSGSIGAPATMLYCAQWLAAALSVHARRHGARSAALIDAYFAELDSESTLVKVLVTMPSWWNMDELLSPPAGVSTTPTVVHFVQHCIELRPQWWLQTLSHVQQHGTDADCVAVWEVDNEVSRRGPCLRCSRMRIDRATGERIWDELPEGPPPLGWSTDAGYDDVSHCSFLP